MNSQKIRLLLIEKDTKSRRAFKEFFKNNELLYNYAIANGFDKAESIYDLHSFDVIISDLSSVDKSASNILQLSKDIPIIVTVTPADEKILFEALSTGVCDYLIKDTDYCCLKFLPWVIQKVLRHKKLEESHRRTELELREQEKKYRTIFEQSRDAIYLTTINGEFIEFNNSMLKLLGYTRKELSNLNAKELYYKEEYRDKFRRDIVKEGSVVDYELQLRKKDGTVIHCLLTTSIMYSKEGKMIGYQGSIRDISERKKAELKMNELYEQLKSANISLSLGYAAEKDRKDALKTVLYQEEIGLLIDADGNILGITEKVRKISNLSRIELLRSSFYDLMEQESRASIKAEIQRALIGSSFQTTVVINTPDSGKKYFEINLMRINMEKEKRILTLLREKKKIS